LTGARRSCRRRQTSVLKGQVAPAKTLPEIVDKLHDDLAAALVLSEVRERIAGEGMLLVDDRSLAKRKDFVTAEINRWSKVVRQAALAGSQ
jgi:tripartite-type tricarboxylate transporter receptor subunit TctC